MNKLSSASLREYCRTCLASSSTTTSYYDLRLLPRLSKLMIRFMSLDVDEESAIYPKRLCKCCYDKLLDYQEFRRRALEATETLYGIVSSEKTKKKPQLPVNIITAIPKVNRRVQIITQAVPELNSEEPPLQQTEKEQRSEELPEEVSPLVDPLASDFCATELEMPPLPMVEKDETSLTELASNLIKKIKAEPIDIDTPGPQTSDAVNMEVEDEEQTTVKNEIGLEYEETECVNNLLLTEVADPEIANDAPTTTRGGYARTSLQCLQCDKKFYKQYNLDAHIRGVHEGHEKPFHCLECASSFALYGQLHMHIQLKHQKQRRHFTCSQEACKARFTTKKMLATHFKVVHSNAVGVGIQEILELHTAQLSAEIVENFTCHVCNKTLSSKIVFSNHMKRHLQIREHICKVCGIAKVTRTELLTHMRTHDANLEKFKCTLCPKLFRHKNAIGRHVRVVHDGVRRYSCQYCKKLFGTRNTQEAHERLHTGERPFHCDQCSKCFAQKDALISHLKNHDLSLRKYVCSYCDRRFITRKNLVEHESRHRGDKPHICTVCNCGFATPEKLVAHEERKHTQMRKSQRLVELDFDQK